MKSQTLVSVGVISYNAAETIIETLDSIYNQSYPLIELIISDDCSSDCTIELCKKWLESHSHRFKEIKVLSSEENRGIPANFNRLLDNISGDWVKIIAADDILLPLCLEDCMAFISDNKSIYWMVGKAKRYVNFFKEDCIIKEDTIYTESRLKVLNGSLQEQQKAILNYTFIEAPALFIKTELFHKIGKYNEEYKFIEDWPMNKKILEAGFKCYFLNKHIVGYRQSLSSVFNNNLKLFNLNFIKSVYKFKVNELFEHHDTRYRVRETLYYKLCVLMDKLKLNKNSKVCRYIWAIANKVLALIFGK